MDNLSLSEFIREVLSQVASGVKAAQDDVRKQGGWVWPAGAHTETTRGAGRPMTVMVDGGKVPIHEVCFDVAVIARGTSKTGTSAQAEGSAGFLRVLTARIGAQIEGETRNESEHAHRVRFSVPIVLPRDKSIVLQPKTNDAIS